MTVAASPYEGTFILSPTLVEDELDTAIEQVKTYITNRGGEITNTDTWGRRRMYHAIKGHRDGNYVLIDFTADPATVHDVEGSLRLDDAGIRSLIVRTNR